MVVDYYNRNDTLLFIASHLFVVFILCVFFSITPQQSIEVYYVSCIDSDINYSKESIVYYNDISICSCAMYNVNSVFSNIPFIPTSVAVSDSTLYVSLLPNIPLSHPDYFCDLLQYSIVSSIVKTFAGLYYYDFVFIEIMEERMYYSDLPFFNRLLSVDDFLNGFNASMFHDDNVEYDIKKSLINSSQVYPFLESIDIISAYAYANTLYVNLSWSLLGSMTSNEERLFNDCVKDTLSKHHYLYVQFLFDGRIMEVGNISYVTAKPIIAS